ncbi:hypothetical protein SO802_034104 [Lithocarpus litseifolius]|uniref:Cytochrome P450 n=1 Tax=Lithocarpus litseifolius TaxID=425828 RepID=A0AAW2BF18_9ROSI
MAELLYNPEVLSKAKAKLEQIIGKGNAVVESGIDRLLDASIWENPNSFKPERFMGSEIDVKGRNFKLIPFGAGRRMCPRLPLALRMLRLMLGLLIHTFHWKVEGGFKPKDIYFEEKFGLTLHKAKPLRAISNMV